MPKSGKFSRSKGIREELQLVHYLQGLGYDAKRVPLSGAMDGFEFDVIATKDGVTHTFEKKSRKCSFKTIYSFYDKYRDADGLRFLTGDSPVLIRMSTDFEYVKKIKDNFKYLEPRELKVEKRILKLSELRKGADFLVIKDNNKPNLFIKYLG